MTLGALACQLCWFWYGLLLNDVYIYVSIHLLLWSCALVNLINTLLS